MFKYSSDQTGSLNRLQIQKFQEYLRCPSITQVKNQIRRVAELCNMWGCTLCVQRETKSGKNRRTLLGLSF